MNLQYPWSAIIFVLLAAPVSGQAPLAGTAPLTGNRDFAIEMVDAINNFLVKETTAVAASRTRFWSRDFSSADAYSKSIEGNRSSLRRMIGAVDERLPASAL
ncbi:MAG TPA: hypothetical protein VN428_14655, partial [Bryobacteraceae bacterium]|nr:hypothetical protein [Bryobacteraceae bacterium]